jgi:hypothetical protein
MKVELFSNILYDFLVLLALGLYAYKNFRGRQ